MFTDCDYKGSSVTDHLIPSQVEVTNPDSNPPGPSRPTSRPSTVALDLQIETTARDNITTTNENYSQAQDIFDFCNPKEPSLPMFDGS